MKIKILKDKYEIGREAGQTAASKIRQSIDENHHANIILATGMSQFETLEQLIKEEDIDWGKVTMFHLDEYIGLPQTEKASFRKYLRERFLDKVTPLYEVHLINGEAPDPREECARLGKIIQENPIDVAFVGIGENGHLAFNDPPADFVTEEPYLIVDLDEKCRKQQLGEGWFNSLEEVPQQAISMSVQQILKSKSIICTIPGSRKAQAVKECIGQPVVSNLHPASILQQHADCSFFLDENSSALLQSVKTT